MISVNSFNVYVRHERYCLKIFVKRDEFEQSSTETPFNEILTDREKVGKSQSSII